MTAEKGGSGKTGAARTNIVARSLIWLIVLALWVYPRIPAGASLFYVRSDLASLIGLSLVVMGVSLYIWAAREIASGVPSARAAPTVLLTRGPYRHVRNPIYLAVALVFVGVSTHYAPWCVSDLWGAALVALLVHLVVVFLEEPATRQRLGPSYDAYCARVPRWIPRLPRTGHQSRPFFAYHRRMLSGSTITADVLQAFADAWNRHDVDALMSFMTEDCVFESSAGPDICGTRFAGREAVRAGFAQVWTTFPDAHWGNAKHFIQGERGVSEWIFTGTRVDGTRVEVHGCDLFTFRDGKIALKNSYRKNRS